MKNKYIINWELSLNCNLDCSFCSQKKRRLINNKSLLIEDVFKIIHNLPQNSHISFLGGETLMFLNIIEIFEKLEEKGITYEITTNGLLIEKYLDKLKTFKNLTKINISIDGYGDFHDTSRGKKGIFDKIIKTIPKIINYKDISISTVITNITDENLVKLYLKLNELGIKEHKLIYLMQFSKQDVDKSINKIKSLKIFSPGYIEIEKNYKITFLRKFALLKKIEKTTKIIIEPETIIRKGAVSCKQLEKQYRINEYGKLSICEFINNSYGDLINEKFENAILDYDYNELKNHIISSFPLDICKNCCKLYVK